MTESLTSSPESATLTSVSATKGTNPQRPAREKRLVLKALSVQPGDTAPEPQVKMRAVGTQKPAAIRAL